MTEIVNMIQNGTDFETIIDGTTYKCYICNEFIYEHVLRIFYLDIKKIKPAQFLGFSYNKTVWRHVYRMGSHDSLAQFNSFTEYEHIDGSIWYNTETIKNMIPTAIQDYYDKIKEAESIKEYAKTVKHPKMI